MPDLPVEFEAGDTLETLIHQFSDPYAFLRELIQNALDAGSGQVDVRTEFRPASQEGRPGLALFTVEDNGEGMTREVIDTQLTRLFSSSKEGDLTKIGKFGIGFVSVFALDPACVVVDTGRDGQSWRILFHPDHSFERILLDMPVDGTRVQVLKPASPREFAEMQARGLEAVTRWCKHCDTEIRYDGARINQAFELGVPRALRYSVPGTEILVAPSAEEKPFFGFYNRGLTLMEGHQEFLPGIQFKLKSRYLEHTLTRDQVLQDENYEKAMALLREAVDGPLSRAMLSELRPDAPDDLLGALVHRLEGLPQDWQDKPLFPTLHGPALSLSVLRKLGRQSREAPYDDAPSPASQELARCGTTVLAWRGPEQAPGLGALLAEVVGPAELVHVRSTWAYPILRRHLPDPWPEMLPGLHRLLAGQGCPSPAVVGAGFAGQGPWLETGACIVQELPGELYRNVPRQRRPRLLQTAGTILVNLDHHLVRHHADLYGRSPRLAVYLLAKALVLGEKPDPESDARLLEAAFS